MFQIEKNIPTPEHLGSGSKPKYPFAVMEVGDSFFAPDMKARALINASQWHANKTGKKFTCSTVEGGARCWRVA